MNESEERKLSTVRRVALMPLLMVFAGGLVTLLLFWQERRSALDDFHLYFKERAEARADTVVHKMSQYLFVVKTVGRLARSSETTDQKKFSLQVLQFLSHYSDLGSRGWILAVPAAERKRFEATAGMEIVERDPAGREVRAGQRDVYYPVRYIDPPEGNEEVIGFDLASDPIFRSALQQARDKGEPVVVERMRLPAEQGEQCYMLLAMYREGMPVDTIRQRKAALQGFAMVALRTEALLSGFLDAAEPGGFSVELIDFSEPEGRVLGQRSGIRSRARVTSWKSYLLPYHPSRLFRFYKGKLWGVRVTPGPAYIEQHLNLSYWLVLPAGFIISLFLGLLLLYAMTVRSQRASMEAIVANRTAELRRHEQHLEELVRERTETLGRKTAFLEALVNCSPDGIMFVDGLRNRLFQNPQYARIRKLPPEMIGVKDDETWVRYLMTTVKNPDAYAARITYLYDNPDETSLDEIELKDGTVLDRYSAPVRAEGGKYYGRIWVFRDITDRKRTDEALRESEKKFKDLVEKSTVGVYLLQDDVFRYVNYSCAALHGYSVMEMTDKIGLKDTVLHDDLGAVADIIDGKGVGDVDSHHREFRIVKKDGEVRNVETYGSHTIYEGRPAIIGTIMDVTDRHRATEALNWKTAFLEAQVNSSVDGIMVFDDRGRRILQNQRSVDMWKIPQKLQDGEDDRQQRRHMMAMTRYPGVFKEKVRFLNSNRNQTSRDEIELKDGGVLDVYSSPVIGVDGKYYGRIWTFRDITELKRYWHMLENLSNTDGLTDIPNRRRFDEFLDREWRRALRERSSLSLLLMDIDFFKEFNDHCGHLAGDDCLRQVAGLLAGIVRRPGDLAARYGGEEFVCVLPDTDAAGALMLARKVMKSMERLNMPHFHSSVADHVTMSIGVTTMIPKKGQPASDLVRLADDLLYAAKQDGRNRIKQWPIQTSAMQISEK